MNNYINYIIIIFILLVFFSCSTDKLSSNDSIKIDNIKVNKVENRAPKESDFQVEVELSGLINEDISKQDVKYDWSVEYIKPDISNNYISDPSSDTLINENISSKKYESGYYFLDIPNDTSNALLIVYRPGYFKIIFKAINSNETQEKTIIIKVGEPEIPELFVKINIPIMNDSESSNFKGKFFLKIDNNLENIQTDNIIELKVEDFKDNWYNTGYTINPFNSFKIQTGTHLLNTDPISIYSFNQNSTNDIDDKIIYSLNGEYQDIINSTPILLKELTKTNLINTIEVSKSGSTEWEDGEIYYSFLIWNKNNDEFKNIEKKLTPKDKSFTIDFINIYQAKIFSGSIGQLLSDKYFIFFGTEGVESEELDPDGLREYPGIPYGFLLGKLGIDGKVFQIGNNYSYNHNDQIQIYSIDDTNSSLDN